MQPEQKNDNQPVISQADFEQIVIPSSVGRRGFLIGGLLAAAGLGTAFGVGHLVTTGLENDKLLTNTLLDGAMTVNIHRDTTYNGHLHSVELDITKNGNFQITLIHRTQELGPKDVKLLEINVSVENGVILGSADIFQNDHSQKRQLNNMNDINLAVMEKINTLVKSTWGCQASSVALEVNFKKPHTQDVASETMLLSQGVSRN